MTRILSECNLVAVLHEFETKHDVVFKDVETGIQRVTKATAWTLHPRLAEFGIDPTLRRAWSRRRAICKVVMACFAALLQLALLTGLWAKVRRGRVTGGRLPIDAWQVVVGTMRAPQFLMLSMTCKGLHEYIRDNHQLWRKTLLRSMGTYTREITVPSACPMPRSVGTLMLGLWIGAELQAARRDARRHAAGGLGVPGHC